MRDVIGWLMVVLQFILLALLALAGWQVHAWPFVIIGLVLVALGILLGLKAFVSLGSALTPTPVPLRGAELRVSGVYAWVRHPIYSAILLAALGLLIAAGSTRGWLVWIILVIFFVLKSRWEDSLLARTHGAEWKLWAARTGALIPKGRPPR